MKKYLAVTGLFLLLVSGAAAQEIDLNFNLNLFGGADDNSTETAQQPQQNQDSSNSQQQEQSPIDRDHSGREVEDDPITSDEEESGGGIIDSISGFVSSIFG